MFRSLAVNLTNADANAEDDANGVTDLCKIDKLGLLGLLSLFNVMLRSLAVNLIDADAEADARGVTDLCSIDKLRLLSLFTGLIVLIGFEALTDLSLLES